MLVFRGVIQYVPSSQERNQYRITSWWWSTKKFFHDTRYLTMLLIVMSLGTLKKSEIEMKPNQAYETVVRPQPATQVHVEPDYEDVTQVHH